MIFNIFNSIGDVRIALIFLVVYVGVLLMSLSVHEFSHAFAAYKCGDPTAKFNGRMTVNPLKHIDPLGLGMLLIVGFGFAKPVPVNPSNYRNYKKGSFLVAIAGVTANLILAFVLSFFSVVILRVAANGITSEFMYWLWQILYWVCYYGAIINIALMVFNLFPFYPLDGFRVLESFTRYNNRFTSWLRKYGRYILFGLLIWSFVCDAIASAFPGTATILYYADIFGFVFNFLTSNIFWLFENLWKLIFF